jgi:hypothetical protein
VTLDERIEAAAFALTLPGAKLTEPYMVAVHAASPQLARQKIKEVAEGILRTAFPELFTTPPTAWIAPIVASAPGQVDSHLSPTGSGNT